MPLTKLTLLPGLTSEFLFLFKELCLGSNEAAQVNESPRKQAGGWLFLPVRLLIANQTFVPPSPATVAGRAAAALEGAGGPSGAGLPVRSAKP